MLEGQALDVVPIQDITATLITNKNLRGHPMKFPLMVL